MIGCDNLKRNILTKGEQRMKKKGWFISALMLVVVMMFSVSALASEKANGNGVTASDGVTYEEDGQTISGSNTLDEAYLTYTTEELIELGAISDNSINPLADELKKSKTIPKTYKNFSDIPEYLSYSEYTGGYSWWGNLPLIKTEKISGGWQATFSGYIYASSN